MKIDALSSNTVTFQVWKQVACPYKDTTIKKTTFVDETVPKSKRRFLGELGLIQHSERVRTQYVNLASDEMAHTVATVFAFLKAIVVWMKQNLAHIQ